jgi:hypothetical protein
MVPEFDPAVAHVLEAFGRVLTPGGSVGLDRVIGALAGDSLGVGGDLARDPHRTQRILDQLCADGLLEVTAQGGSDTSARRYGLTRLGWARVQDKDDDD